MEICTAVKALERNGAGTEFERDFRALAVDRGGRERDVVERQGIVTSESEDNVLAVAA